MKSCADSGAGEGGGVARKVHVVKVHMQVHGIQILVKLINKIDVHLLKN